MTSWPRAGSLSCRHFEAALKATSGDKVDGKRKGAILAQFWGGHQRFFNQVITSMQMPTVIRAVEKRRCRGAPGGPATGKHHGGRADAGVGEGQEASGEESLTTSI